jgi:hypothetical protein
MKHEMYHGQQNIHWMPQGLFLYDLISVRCDILDFKIGSALKSASN